MGFGATYMRGFTVGISLSQISPWFQFHDTSSLRTGDGEPDVSEKKPMNNKHPLTHWRWKKKWLAFCRRQFEIHFLEWTSLYFDSNFTEICSWSPLGNKVNTGWGNINHGYYHTRPLFQRGEDYVCESPLGDSSFVMNIRNPFMHCVTSQYVGV